MGHYWQKISNNKKLASGALVVILILASVFWWQRQASETSQVEEEKGQLSVELPANYQQPMIIKTFGQMLKIMPLDARAAEREELPSGAIVYKDAYPNTDVEQIKYPNKLKESLILKTANHPDSFEYRIDRQNFDWAFDGEGNIIISSKQKNGQALPSSEGGEITAERMQQYAQEQAKIFKIPKPFMIQETRDKKQDTNNIDTGEVKADIIGDKLILTPDKEWLKNHQYPIVVDPTVEKMPSMIKELAEKRSYNSLTFLNDDGSYTTMTHVGQINYKDEDGKFKLVNTNLVKNDLGWQQSSASYASKFPVYADDWLEFENRYEQGGANLKIKPIAKHVVGKLVTEETDPWHDKKIVYPKAFGEDDDLELVAGNIGILKLIKLNNKPDGLEADKEFDFELDLGEEKLIINNQEWNGKDEIITSEPIGIKNNDGRITYLRKFAIWDNQGRQGEIKIKISKDKGKTYFSKILPKEFLEQAEYPVYTDASVSYYAGQGDGYIYEESWSWDLAHDSTYSSGAVSYTATDGGRAFVLNSDGTTSVIYRSFYPVYTADLPDGASVVTANFYIYVRAGWITDGDNDSYDYLNIVQTTQASSTILSVTDFDQCGAINAPTEGSTDKDLGTISTNVYTNFALNAAGLTWVNTTGYTMLGIREGHDIDDHPIAIGATGNGVYADNSEYAGTSHDPYLSITYGVSPTATTVTDTPDPTNPGRSVSFIYDWNDDAGDSIKIKICKTNALTNQNCDDGYWATSTDFTTSDPATVVYDVVAGDAGQTRNYWAFACDNGGLCTTGTAGTFSVNAQNVVPNIKVRGGLRVR